MAPSPPPRRFAPEPVETTTKSSKAARRQSPDARNGEKAAPRRFVPEPVETSSKQGLWESKDKVTPRRFVPEPVETSTKSSRDTKSSQGEVKPRRFAPEPVETSQKSSKDKTQQDAKPPPRRFAPEPVETSHKSSKDKAEKDAKPAPRRFAPQPVETSQKSSKDKAQQNEKPPPRRFAPEPVETSKKSSKDMSQSEKPAHIRFLPQPVETLHRTNRKPQDDGEAVGPTDDAGTKKPRRFAPVLLDTASRTRKNGNASALSPQDFRTESGHQVHAREHRRHIRGDKTPVGDDGAQKLDVDALSRSEHLAAPHALELRPDLRRHLSPMDGSAPNRKGSMSSQRSHSFRCPELDTIESSESEPNSQASSLSSSPGQASPITTSDSSYTGTYKHATRVRESVDESFTHYLLQIEQKKAEARMRDQALAAFPNSDFHEPVDHYMTKEDDSDDMEIEDRPVTWADYEDDLLLQMAARRESTVKISWEQMEMQRHAENLEQERAAAKVTNKQPSQSPWWNPENAFGVGQPDSEMQSMQDRARPPMLGSDLKFPRCRSPEPARFDVTQGSATLRNQMCYLTEAAEAEKRRTGDDGGLWKAKDAPSSKKNTTTSPKKPTSPHVKGLWGGFCVDDGEHPTPGLLAPPTGQTGLMTPAVEHPINPFEQSFASKASPLNPIKGAPGIASPLGPGLQTPATPVRVPDLNGIDSMLHSEQELDRVMEREFPDSFITQVYNYLSLGYPSLARPFDDELAKISRIPIQDLRRDDKKARENPKGYIRLGTDFEGGGGQGVSEVECMRWQALKVYVREWARQEKDMVKTDGPGGNWGTGARRGSWAI